MRSTNLQKNIRIIAPRSWTNAERGEFFERVTEQLLNRQSYETTQRLRFTGMEIDLLARHRPSADDVYVEAKFYSTALSANVVDLMLGQAFRRDISRLALFSTSILGKDANGAVHDIKSRKGISFSFYGPTELLFTFEQTGLAPTHDESNIPSNISSSTLIVHPEINLFWIHQEQKDGQPFRGLIQAAPDQLHDLDRIRKILNDAEILEGLPLESLPLQKSTVASSDSAVFTSDDQPAGEIVSTVSTADDLIDYRPCNPADFVGRSELQKEIWDFLGKVRDGRTNTRLITIIGSSGFGKSSLVAKLAQRFKNKKWKSKYYLYPIDVRSARGALFVSEAVISALSAATTDGFITPHSDLRVDDADNILLSNSIQEVLKELREQKKVIVLFFDQFEEAFTKDELMPVFRAFRRFALDVHGQKTNLVLGFSWRTGISLSDGNPSYQLWHELSDHRLTKTLDAFSGGESSRVISQFEDELKAKILPPLRRRLHEQGQGLPWFLKKLCVHIYGQINNGVSQLDLLGSRLNVESLFDEDLNPLTDSQLSCLKFIAANSPADSLDVYEQYGPNTVSELVERRLVIRAGQRIAVYWDVFRDYLTDEKVPYIPWTYIPNSTPSMCIAACEAIASADEMSTPQLAEALGYSESTILNITTDLQNLAVWDKTAAGNHKLLDSVSLNDIPQRMREQFSEHVVYQQLLKSATGGHLTREYVIEVVRKLYSEASVKPATRDNYSARMLPYLEYCGLVESDSLAIRIMPPEVPGQWFGKIRRFSGRRRANSFLGTATPESALLLLKNLKNTGGISRLKIKEDRLRNPAADLIALNLARWTAHSLVPTTEALSQAAVAENILRSAVRNSSAISILQDVMENKPNLSRQQLGEHVGEHLERNWKKSSALRYANGLARYRDWIESEWSVDSA